MCNMSNKMIPEIIENFEYFSGLTQKTLSAFHISGINNDLSYEIENVKKYLNENKYKIIKNVSKTEDNKYIRYFTDGSSDIVEFEFLEKPVKVNISNIDIIDKALSKELNPISSLKYNKTITETYHKEIVTATEKLFFIDMLDCI